MCFLYMQPHQYLLGCNPVFLPIVLRSLTSRLHFNAHCYSHCNHHGSMRRYNAELGSARGYQISDCFARFFQKRLVWQSQELASDSLRMENAFGAQALHHAQKNLEPRWPEGRNTVTGLVNFGHVTCWLNAAVQLLWHSSFMSEWLDYAETRGREARNHA